MFTERQQEVYDYLRQQFRDTGIIPSSREIQHHFGFASQTAAMSHLKTLERKGVIKRIPGKARAIMFTDAVQQAEVVNIPVYGQIAAGMASEVEQEEDGRVTVEVGTFDVSRGNQPFALKVRGDSMIDAHIMSGDVVILERKPPKNRDIVAALIDGETTLKRFITKGRSPYLQAENPDYPDLIPARELEVQGVMVGLMRNAVVG